jgi:hypothetical protein
MTSARPFNTWDALKLLALVLMVIDHIGHFFFPEQLWLRAIGRSAAPIFLFLAGYAASYRLRWDVVILGLALTTYNFILQGGFFPLNILLTITCCRMILAWREKHGGIKRPLEWYAGAMACFLSLAVIQYGSFALLFALCGYMKRFIERYDLRTRQAFWLLTFAAYALVEYAATLFSPLETLLMLAVMLPVIAILWRMKIRPLALPALVAPIMKWMARNMAYIYAAHLALFMWLTKIPF